jgi:dTDP-D-glucose 4,6-dehydratase
MVTCWPDRKGEDRQEAVPGRRCGDAIHNTRLRQVLKWEPRVPLEVGLATTYTWIEKQVAAKLKAAGAEVRRRRRL